MSDIRLQVKHNNKNVLIQRKNLVAVCRFAVKSLIDKACFEAIEEDCEELTNFCAVMEHVLNHRLKTSHKWYKGGEKVFWDYMKIATRHLPHNCVANIEAVEVPKTSRGKGRAWLRVALMEKRLGEYVSTALQETKLTRSFYQEGAIMLTEEGQMIAGLLLGLNAIDFSFDIRAENLDIGHTPFIDFTPYLRFEQRKQTSVLESVSSDQREFAELSRMSASISTEVFEDQDDNDDLPTRYAKLDEKYKLVSEQKGYLEELVRLRESQLEETQKQRQKLIDTLHHYQLESRRERQQLEAVIIELQAQIQGLKESHRVERQRLETLVRRYSSQPPKINQPEIALMDMSTIPPTPAPPDLQSQCSTDSPVLTTHAKKNVSLDSRSIVSGASNVSAATKEETQSMVPLAGSFTSETSFRSPETGLGSHDPKPTNEHAAGDQLTQKSTPKTSFPSNTLTVHTSPIAQPETENKREEDSKAKESRDVTHKPDVVAGCEEGGEKASVEKASIEPDVDAGQHRMESIDLEEQEAADNQDN